MRTFAVLILLLASVAASAQTERTTPASEAELAQITERGRNSEQRAQVSRRRFEIKSLTGASCILEPNAARSV